MWRRFERWFFADGAELPFRDRMEMWWYHDRHCEGCLRVQVPWRWFRWDI